MVISTFFTFECDKFGDFPTKSISYKLQPFIFGHQVAKFHPKKNVEWNTLYINVKTYLQHVCEGIWSGSEMSL